MNQIYMIFRSVCNYFLINSQLCSTNGWIGAVDGKIQTVNRNNTL